MSKIAKNITPFFLFGFCLGMACQTTNTTNKAPGPSSSNPDRSDDQIDKEPVTVSPDTTENTEFSDTELSDTGDEQPSEDSEDVWIPPEGDFVLKDKQTGSLWNLRGEAYKGPLKGAKLQKYPAFNSFWFAWSVFYHGSQIWGRDKPNQTADVQDDESDCFVPCNEIKPNLPKDAIPAFSHDDQGPLPNSEMVPVDSQHAEYLKDSDFVFGVVIDGKPRAYSHNVLWHHEIYNDRVGDRDFAVTFCPLTGSGIAFAGKHGEKKRDFGVSGKLYNSNLVMFDRTNQTEWSQMLGIGVTGPEQGEELTRLPVVETTWERWKQMYPDTLVTPSNNAGRNYRAYPYGSYRTDHSDTFAPTNPSPDAKYKNKKRILGLVGDEAAKGYPFPELEEVGDRVVVNDTFEETPVTVVYESAHRMAIPLIAKYEGQTLTFKGKQATGGRE